MSGRAGRRGLDERGIVMLMVDEKMDSAVGKGLLKVREVQCRLSFLRSVVITSEDEVAEWLRRWTANPLCFARVGSNPTLVDIFF